MLTLQLKLVLAALLAATLFLGYNYIGARAVAEYKDSQTALKAEADKVLQAKYDKLSESYEDLRTKRREKAEITERIIEKIVERPVYMTVCADAEGIEAANKALRGE